MKANWRNWIEIGAAVSVVLSLLLVAYELRLSRAAAGTQQLTDMLTNHIELRSLLAENHEVWQRGCVGDELSDADASQFAMMVRAYHIFQFIRWRNASGSISDLEVQQPPLQVALMLHRFPGFRNAWRLQAREEASANSLYTSPTTGWSELIERLYTQLQEIDPNPSRDIRLCGI